MNQEEQKRYEKRLVKANLKRKEESKFIDIKGFNIVMSTKGMNKFVAEKKAIMSNTFEEVTAKYGMLQSIGYCGYFEESAGKGRVTYRTAILAKCDCGNYSISRLRDVMSGKKKSCGCQANNTYLDVSIQAQKAPLGAIETNEFLELEIERNRNRPIDLTKKIKPNKSENVFHKKFMRYESGSKKRRSGIGIYFDLNKVDFENLIKQNCTYCNEPAPEKGHGLDRVNNELGYVYNNVVSCCSVCNKMKFILTKNEFLNKVKQIADYNHLVNKI